MWHLYDLIDLEYYLHFEQTDNSLEAQNNRHFRDRTFYVETIKTDTNSPSRGDILFSWLQFRRKKQPTNCSDLQPGQIIKEIFQLSQLLVIFLGLLCGWAIGFSFFHYSGTEPLNVFSFLAIFILSQIFLTLTLLISTFFRIKEGIRFPPPLLYKLLAKGFLCLLQMSKKKTLEKLTASQRLSFEATLGTLVGKKEYGALLYWPLFSQIQLFGICFNLSLLAVSIFNVIVTDLAFGWQSTVQFSNEAIHSFVQLLAIPWSWIISHPYPTLAEIEGSRIILKDGIVELSTPDLISWWPFLLSALLVYGLLPRIIFFAAGLYLKKNKISKIQFTHSTHDSLFQRMLTPHVTTQAEPEKPEEKRTNCPSPPSTNVRDSEKTEDSRNHDELPANVESMESHIANNKLTIFIAADIFHSCPEQELTTIITRKGYGITETICFGEDIEQDLTILQNLSQSKIKKSSGVLFILEAWMPPISDFTLFLQDLRNVLPAPIQFRIGLIGKPTPKTIFTPVEKSDFDVWNKKIISLGDPHLRVEHLITSVGTPSPSHNH
jgi:hypothetical protein